MRFLFGTLGWGVVIYALLYLLWSGLAAYGAADGVLSLVVRLIALALVTTLAARSLRMPHWLDIVPYAISWAFVAVVLDAILLMPFLGLSLYTSWSVWVGYALVAFIPVIASWRRAPRSA